MRSQRHDPYPWTWEPAAATLCILIVLGLIAAKAGTTMAAWILGRPTPLGTDLVAALNALAQAPMPDQAVTIGAIIAAELVALLTAGWGIHRLAHNVGATGPRGFATPTEAQRTLGSGRLHRQRRIIRPDFHQRIDDREHPESRSGLSQLGARGPSFKSKRPDLSRSLDPNWD